MRHKVSVDRHKPYVGVGSLKLKFSIEDVFFSKEKIKKKKEKKRIEVTHCFRQTDKVSIGRPTSLSNKTTPGPLFFSNFELPPLATAILSGRSYVNAI